MDQKIESEYRVEKSTEMENININNVFLHHIGYSNIIDDESRPLFYTRIKSILEHSLVSYNYYGQFVKNEENNCYSQRWGPRTNGYSKDYVSLIDPVVYNDVRWGIGDLSLFVENPGVYIVLKRGLIENLLTESKEDLTTPTKIKAINNSFIDPNHQIGDPVEYVIGGEVKVRDKIPSEEICAIALGEVVIDMFQGIDFISQILNETNMEHLPILKLENTPYRELSLTIPS